VYNYNVSRGISKGSNLLLVYAIFARKRPIIQVKTHQILKKTWINSTIDEETQKKTVALFWLSTIIWSKSNILLVTGLF
jgi:hypothetical protein